MATWPLNAYSTTSLIHWASSRVNLPGGLRKDCVIWVMSLIRLSPPFRITITTYFILVSSRHFLHQSVEGFADCVDTYDIKNLPLISTTRFKILLRSFDAGNTKGCPLIYGSLFLSSAANLVSFPSLQQQWMTTNCKVLGDFETFRFVWATTEDICLDPLFIVWLLMLHVETTKAPFPDCLEPLIVTDWPGNSSRERLRDEDIQITEVLC